MNSERPVVLVATRNPAVTESLKNVLETQFLLTSVEEADTVIAQVKESSPCLVILDTTTPELDGTSLCKRIKESALMSGLPIMVLVPDEKLAGPFLAHGASDCLLQPLEPSVVHARLRSYLNLSRCIDTLKRVSLVDDLTGVANRRRFDEFLNMEWRRNLRNQTSLSIVLMDLDFFAAFNDCYGSLAGDEALQRIARTLSDIIRRPGDLFAWYGRGRFACVLPETDTVGAVSVAEHLRAEVFSLSIPNESSPIAKVLTASLGIGTGVPMNGAEPEDLLTVAERHLFSAKRAGRNRAVFGS